MAAVFDPPGPGQWALDRSHYPGGTTPIGQELLEDGFRTGFERVFTALGMPAERLDCAFVNGYLYTRLRPLIGADKPPKRPPPAPLLRIAARLHPAFRSRAKQAKRTLEERPWLAMVDEWERDMKPKLLAANRRFQDVDVSEIGDDDLQQHIVDLLDHLRETFELHFWLHGFDMPPIARLLYTCEGWGIDPIEVIDLLAGASPSTSRPVARLCRLRDIVESQDGAVDTLDDVRAISAEAAQLLDEHLDAHGHVLSTGYDLVALTLVEMPDVVLRSIRAARPEPEPDLDALVAPVRSQVPEAERAFFDELLDEARSVMDMRDDNGPLTGQWPLGLLRRALLEAGRRLHDRGRVDAPEHLLEVTSAEARTVFTDIPEATELARRSDVRAEQARMDPPATLGPDEPAPPLDVLPEILGDMVGMVMVSMRYMGMDASEGQAALSGAGIGTGRHVGTARVAASAEEAMLAVEPGDVLVVRATSPSFNTVLAMVGAVVTADGGPLSHAAVIARELGFPAVIGAPGALDIPDGAEVEVDAATGTVRVLTPA